MLRRVAGVLRCPSQRILAGEFQDALAELNALKQQPVAAQPEDVDLQRATCFLQLGDPLHARAALQEQLRRVPSDEKAFDLYTRLDAKLGEHGLFVIPAEVAATEPEFALLYESLRHHSMLSWQRLLSLFRQCRALSPDDARPVVECGSAGGGSAVLMAVACGGARRVYACDSYGGMPPPATADERIDDGVAANATGWGHGTCAAPVDAVTRLARAFGVSDAVVPVPGLFQDSLPPLVDETLRGSRVSLLHLDADWYESTAVSLRTLQPCLGPAAGGAASDAAGVDKDKTTTVQCDDYHYWRGARRAVDEWRVAHASAVSPSMRDVGDGNGALFDVVGPPSP